ncbi:hypothetical protein EK21DRAFT_79268 [Setomelanomma holmii]|uniref:Uncharacterized protein n=1 Tax=Setomelanomma holmii TaxID=210430 RepID=A0A9P4LF83_9PLEO|nr:hypothetical protein EK21DRAFT_79268 [Setomelanomma holmii]
MFRDEIDREPAMTPQGLERVELGQYALGKRFFITKNGFFGLEPKSTKKGDHVVVFLGEQVPFVLRQELGHYRVVGETYVEGLMHGETLEQYRVGRKKVTRIALR